MFAMLLAALAPALAQAVVSASGRSELVEVCSVSGMIWVKADRVASGHQDGGTLAEAAMKCPWCSLHGGLAGLPSQVMAAHHFGAGAASLAGADSSPEAGTVWLGAVARGPPPAS